MAFGPARLYHRDNLTGKVFTDEGEYEAHLANGWVDFPTKVDMKPEQKQVEVPPVEQTAPSQPDTPEIRPKRPGRPAKKFKGGK